MGLTVHFKPGAPGCGARKQAKGLAESMHRAAVRFQRQGLVDGVGSITSDLKTLGLFACDWLILPVPGEENTSTGAEVPPTAGFLFPVEVGRDCEPLWLGLCHYPDKVRFHGQELRTKKAAGWRLAGSSKTQYAGLHGWDHFLRCHCAVVELLAACRGPGLRVKIVDEGGYWPERSLTRLRLHLEEMNRLVAATAGALKDGHGATGEAGGSPVASPIFAHPRFERLEAEGAARVAPLLQKLRAALAKQ